MKKHGPFVIALLGLLAILLFAGCSYRDEDQSGVEIRTRDASGNIVLENIVTGEQRELPDTLTEALIEAEAEATPDPNQSGLGGLLGILLVLSLASGCVTRNEVQTGPFSVVNFESDSGTKANANAQITGYSRGGIQEGSASEGSTSEDENWTDAVGGGEVAANTDVGGGDDTQGIEEPATDNGEPATGNLAQ
jgi:hypothetical protein